MPPKELADFDYALAVADGRRPNVTAVNKFGHNGALAMTTTEDIWDGPTATWVAPLAARIHDIASDSASDASAGVGARTLRVWGLTSWSTAEVSEDIILNGVANVPTVNAYVIIHRLEVLTKGATSTNVGTITATAQTDGTVTATILPNGGQTRMCIYGVPSIQKLHITAFEGSIDAVGPTANIIIVMNVNPEPDAELLNFLQKHRDTINGAGSSKTSHTFNPYFPVPGPAIIKLSAFASIAASVNGGFDGYLVTQ